MDGDTRKLILRTQSEDLAALWSASTDEHSEIDATLRVYRRQLKLLDRHLENTRQPRTTGDTAEAARRDAVTAVPQTPDTDTPILTGDGGVHQIDRVHSRQKESAMFAPAASTPPITNAMIARPLLQISDMSAVGLPPSVPIADELSDDRFWHRPRAATINNREKKACEEAERKEATKRKLNVLNAPVKLHRPLQPASSCGQPMKDMSIDDIYEVWDQLKVQRMMTIVPNRAISVLYKALQDCHGNFDDAIDMILRQEADGDHIDGVDLTNSAIKSHSAQNDAQPRAATKQLIEGTTRATANKHLTNPKSTGTTMSTTVDHESTLVSTEPSTTTATNLKRSAEHFTLPSGPSSKKHTSVTIKKESECEPGLSAQKDTVRDKLKHPLQSSRSLPGPTPRAANTESHHIDHGISYAPPPPPPGHYQKPDMRSNAQRSGPPLGPRATHATLFAPHAPPPPPPSGPRSFQGNTQVRRRR
jgi:hypothetical protein